MTGETTAILLEDITRGIGSTVRRTSTDRCRGMMVKVALDMGVLKV